MRIVEIKGEKVSKEYDYISSLDSDGLRIARLGNKKFLINEKGEKVSKEYCWMSSLDSDGLRIARLDDEKFKNKSEW